MTGGRRSLPTFLRGQVRVAGTHSIAMGIALGTLLGFSPLLSLQTFFLLLLLALFRIHLVATLCAFLFGKLLALLAAPVADDWGRAVLEASGLRSLFRSLYNMPLIPLTRFNNSLVMGESLIGVVLALGFFFAVRNFLRGNSPAEYGGSRE